MAVRFLLHACQALLLLGTSANVLAADSATDRRFQPLPAAQWQVEVKAGDAVELAATDDYLGIKYQVNVKDIHQVGHQPFKEASFRLLLTSPVSLNPRDQRIVFTACGLDRSRVTRGATSTWLFPLLRDTTGEILTYQPYPYPHFLAGTKGWSDWMTQCFSASECGAATHDIFEAEGGDGNAWPDGNLTLLGFLVRVRRAEFGPAAGTLLLGAFGTAELRLPVEDPYLYADAFFVKPPAKPDAPPQPLPTGTYALGVEIRNAYQALPIRQYSDAATFDPASLTSRCQKIVFPLGPDDSYWVRYRLADSAGAIVAEETLRHEIEGRGPLPALTPVALSTPPAIGHLRFNPDAHTDGVYGTADPIHAVVRVFPKGETNLELQWQAFEYLFDTQLATSTAVLTFPDDRSVDVPVLLELPTGRDACRLRVTLHRHGQEIDRGTYVLGRKTDFRQPYAGRPGTAPRRNEIKASAFFLVTYAPPKALQVHAPPYNSAAACIADFSAFLDQARGCTPFVNYMLNLPDLEVLPGVYDFSLLDKLMDAAADHGCAMTIRPIVQDRVPPLPGTISFPWLKYDRQRNYDGAPNLNPVWGGGYSPCSPGFNNFWLASLQALHDRYRDHRAFLGYGLYQPMSEVPLQEAPYMGVLTGYEKVAAAGFRDYLRTTRGLSLEQVNARWGTMLQSWDEVTQPMPDFTTGRQPDLRPQWVDFMLFKEYLQTDWLVGVTQRLRRFDPDRLVIAHCGDPLKLMQLADYVDNGGNHLYERIGEYVTPWEKGSVGTLTEPHHPHGWAAYGDPAEAGWVLDWSTFIMLAQGDGGSANLHVYWTQDGIQSPKPEEPYGLLNHFAGWQSFDRMTKFQTILRELRQVKIIRRPEVAVLRDPATLYTKHRTVFEARRDDLQRWLGLLKTDSVDFENWNPEHAAQYKLVLPNLLDEVMKRDTVTTAVGAVKRGAKMVISARTGMYALDSGDAPFQLLNALGIQSPTGPWVVDEPDVKATAERGPLFAPGTSVPFYSLADYRRDLKSPAIQAPEIFWQWAYRWLPQTDYFGYYRDNRETNGQVLARFASGGVALSLHAVGAGEVLVFWGTPDYRPDVLKGFMNRALAWAGGSTPNRDNPIPYMMEGDNARYGRHYALLFQAAPGSYRQKLPQVPDGDWFVDDLVGDRRFGTWTGKELREQGLELNFEPGCSPLKVLRLVPLKGQRLPTWLGKYRRAGTP